MNDYYSEAYGPTSADAYAILADDDRVYDLMKAEVESGVMISEDNAADYLL